MEINITTTKTKTLIAGDYNVTKESIKVEISDQDLLKLGRKYFELASGVDRKETTLKEWMEKELEKDPEFKDEYMLLMARDIKEFCKSQSNCSTCPFKKEMSGRGIWFCKLADENTKGFVPADWEV